MAEGRPTISASKETHLQLPPDCLVKGCNRTFEGQVPDDWLETEFSFVATRYDGAHRPVELLPMKVGVFRIFSRLGLHYMLYRPSFPIPLS